MSTARYPSEPRNPNVLYSPTFKPAVHETLKDPNAPLYFPPKTIPWAKLMVADEEIDWSLIGVDDGEIPAIKVADVPWGTLDYVQVTADQTIVASGTETDLTSLTRTVTVGTSRRIRLSAQGILSRSVADGITIGRFKESTTELGRWGQHSPSALTEFGFSHGAAILTPSAGSHTYKLTLQRFSGTGNVTLNASATSPAWLLVEDIGPV